MNKKLIIIIMIIIDSIIIGMIGGYVYTEKRNQYEVLFSYEDISLKESTLEVNNPLVDAKIIVTVDGEDRSDLLQIDDSRLDTSTLGTYEII